MNTSRTPAVRLAGVTKDFGDVHAVRGIDLEIQPGEMVAFLGPNGAGKTTTIDMVLGLSQPDHRRASRCSAWQPRQAIARGLVAAVMQTGGLLKDLTVRETVQYTASLFADTKPVDAGARERRHHRDRRPQGGQVLRRRAAAAPVRDGAAVRPGAAAARRADHGHGRRGSALVLVRDPRGRRAGPHGAVRDPLPRGGRPVRRPDRPDQQRPHRRRRHRQRDQGARLRPHRARHADPTPTPTALGGARRASTRRGARRAGLRARQGQRRRRPLPAHRDRRPRPRDHRARPRGRVPQPDRRTTSETEPGPERDADPRPKEPCDEHDPARRPAERRVPPLGGFNADRAAHRAAADAAQPAHDHLRAGLPGRDVLRLRLGQPGHGDASAPATSRRTSWSRWRCTAAR